MSTDTLEGKRMPSPGKLAGDSPGPVVPYLTPGRPAFLRIVPSHEKRVAGVPEEYTAHLPWPLHPALARNKNFDVLGPRTARLDADFIQRIAMTARGDTARPLPGRTPDRP